MNKKEALAAFEKFLDTIETLRSPEGCPWDKVQTPMSMRRDLIEEAIEASAAISENNPEHAKEELGDIFLNTLMVSYMYEQSGDFKIGEVIGELTEKLIRRHPHVFKDSSGKSQMEGNVKSSEEVLKQWDKIKDNVEGRKMLHILDEVPENFPVMLRAFKLQKKAAKKGFDWKEKEPVIEKIREELEEVQEAAVLVDSETEKAGKLFASPDQHVEPFTTVSTPELDSRQKDLEGEVGDLLFAVVNYARHLGVNPEVALDRTNRKFKKRFDFVETKMEENKIPMDLDHLKEMDVYWDEAKKSE